MLRKSLPWILASFFLAFVAWIIQDSDAFKECVQKYNGAEPQQKLVERVAYSVFLLKACTGSFIQENGEGITAFFTVVLALSTIFLWRSTEKLWSAAVQQGRDMENSIAEASRSATAMETVAERIADNSRIASENIRLGAQIALENRRAYLAVDMGGALYQEREKQLRFEARPVLTNVGQTPAHNVSYWAKADILPFPIPPEFDFPGEDVNKYNLTIHPRQGIGLNAYVERFVPDDSVDDIKLGLKTRLAIWGVVTYRDVEGNFRETRFCHTMYWVGSGDRERVMGSYHAQYNIAS